MRRLTTLAAALCLVAPVVAAPGQTAAAQNTINVTWKCAPPNPMNSLPVADKPNHAYAIDQATCTTTKGEIGGVKEKDGSATEFMEVTGNTSKGHGIFVETLTNGDKIFYSYTLTGTTNNNVFQSGGNSWTITGGTGKFKGITGKGTCKGKGNPDGSADFDCTGTYAIK